MYLTNNLIITDLDEIIWPNKYNTIKEMLINYNNLNSNGYIFYSRLFKTEIINYQDALKLNSKDIDMFDYHKYCDFKKSTYNKYIIHNLSTVIESETHFIRDYIKKYKSDYIPYEYGFIRHTRRFRNDMKKKCISKWINYYPKEKEEIINNRMKLVKDNIKII